MSLKSPSASLSVGERPDQNFASRLKGAWNIMVRPNDFQTLGHCEELSQIWT
jgi:hypothetical protein